MIATLDRGIAEAREYLSSIGVLAGRSPDRGCEDEMRYAARRDTTHATVRDGLRQAGYSVFDAGGVGGDFPDLVVGAYQRFTFLVEVKSPGGKVSPGQSRFAREWKGGPVLTVYSLEQALGEIIKHVRASKPAPAADQTAWGA